MHFVFFWGGWGDVGFFGFLLSLMCSHRVLTNFPTSSSSSQCALQHVPNSTSLYPISFALSYTLVNYISSPKGEECNISTNFVTIQPRILFIIIIIIIWVLFWFVCNGYINYARHKRKKNKIELWGCLTTTHCPIICAPTVSLRQKW